MGDAIDPPPKTRKKKVLPAFLRSTPKPAPTYDETFDFNNDEGSKEKQQEEDDDGLDMFQRSKDFFPLLVNKEETTSFRTTPKPENDHSVQAAADSDEGPTTSSSRSSKRRKLSSPGPAVELRHSETHNDLYGPATPPRRSSKSGTPVSRGINRSTSASVDSHEMSASARSKGKGKEKLARIHSDLLPTPTSRANSHYSPAEAGAPDDDEGTFDVDDLKAYTPSPRKAEAEPKSTGKRSATPIVLEDSDDELIDAVPQPKEDEFAHFIAAARKRQDEAAKAAAAAAADGSDASSDNEVEPSTTNARVRRKNGAPSVTVKVFVHSRIAHADLRIPFGCLRKIESSLGPVKEVFVQWLRKHGIVVSEEMENEIFLTWKGRRIYESVSGTGLGWEVQANGKLQAPERTEGYERGGVLLEAWTNADFERNTADQERQRLVARGDLAEEGGAVEDDHGEDEEEEPHVAKLRLFFKEKDKEPSGLSAYADTQVRVLIGAYRRKHNIPDDRDIRFNFDGDFLDPKMTVEEAEIDDRCTIEVYIR